MTDEERLKIAFVQGAQWWEYFKTGATMWPFDRNRAWDVAGARLLNGSLGKTEGERLRAKRDDGA